MHDYSLYHEKIYEMLDDFSHNTESRIQNTVQILNYFDNGKTIKMKNKMSFPYMDAEEDYYISYGADIYYTLYNRLMVLESFQFRLKDCVMTQEERKVFYKEAARQMGKGLCYGTLSDVDACESDNELYRLGSSVSNLKGTNDFQYRIYSGRCDNYYSGVEYRLCEEADRGGFFQ